MKNAQENIQKVRQAVKSGIIITQAMAAEITETYPQYIRFLIVEGHLRPVKVMGRNMISLDDLQEYVARKN